MKSKIAYSGFCKILTLIISTVLLTACILTYKREIIVFVTVLSVFLILLISALQFGVRYLKATPDYLILGSPLRRKKILMRSVASVQLFQPTMGAIRVCGSGGFMGYWGIFKEGDIGRYYAFYGKAKDCFLVRMKNGDKYVLGSDDAVAMVDYINNQLKSYA